MRREVVVPASFRDESGEIVETTFRIQVGSETVDPETGNAWDPESPVAGTWRRFMEQEKLRDVPGDWIPLAHVPRSLIPDPDYRGFETEPTAPGTYWEAEWSRHTGTPRGRR